MAKGKTIGGVDLSQLHTEAVLKDNIQSIPGEKYFTEITANDFEVKCNSSCHIKDLLINLTENTVKINQAAKIIGTKTFKKDLLILNELNVNGYVNGINIPSDLVHWKGSIKIRGKKAFARPVVLKGKVMLNDKLNSFNVSEWLIKALRLQADQNITGKLVFFDEVEFKSNLAMNGAINGRTIPDDLVKVEGDEDINGHKKLNGKTKINEITTTGMVTSSLIDGVDVSKLNRTIVRNEGRQLFSGNFTFQNGLDVTGNLIAGGNVNGLNLTQINESAMKIFGKQVISGKKVRLFSPFIQQ